MVLRRILYDVNESPKSKMAAAEPEMHVFQFVYMIESKFQKNLPRFRGWPIQWH